MKTKSRSMAAVLAAVMLAGSVPAKAADGQNVAWGILVVLGVTLGIVAYQHDIGHSDDKELKVEDQTDRAKKKKEGAKIEIVPPPERAGDESNGSEIAAGIALTAKF